MTSADPSLPQTRAEPSPQRRDIQGLRAVAVLLVIVNHAVPAALPGGYVGVDVFFVISGFLITGQIARELATHTRFDFATFYTRRIRRILPASLVVALATLVASLIWLPPTLLEGVARDAAATAFYIPNIAFAVEGTDYLAGTEPSPFQHYWSLGIEEQFYLFWPLLLVAAWMLAGRRSWSLRVVAVVAAATSFAWCLDLSFSSPVWAFFSLPTRAWELAVGGVAALVAPAVLHRVGPRLAAGLSWLGIVCIGASAVWLSDDTVFPGWAAVFPVLGATLVVLWGNRAAAWGPNLVLASRPAQFVGGISYSLYLVHWPLLIIPITVVGASSELPVATRVILAIIAVPIAWLLYRVVEQPFRVSRVSRRLTPRVAIGGAALSSVVVALLAFASLPVADARLNAYGEATSAQIDITAGGDPRPEFSEYVPSNLTPSLSNASSDIPVVYEDGCHLDWDETELKACSYGDEDAKQVVALFGDSHAAQWFPALVQLAETEGFRLDSYTKSSCPSASVDVMLQGLPYEECTTWRAAVMERLTADPADVVVISNSTNGAEARVGDWVGGLASTVSELASVSPVVVIADTPYLPLEPPTCLGANLGDTSPCSAPRDDVIRDEWAAAITSATLQAEGEVIDLNDYLCSDTECGSIVGANLVYRDAHHLTATFAEALAPVIWGGLEPLLTV